MSRRHPSLRRQLGIVLLILTAGFVVGAALGTAAFSRVDDTNRALTGTLFEAQAASRERSTSFISQDATLRGYLANEDAALLGDFNEARRREDESVRQLRRALSNKAGALAKLEASIAASKRWHAEYADIVVVGRAADVMPTTDEANKGRELFEVGRRANSALFDDVILLRQQAAEQQRDALTLLRSLAIATFFGVLALGLVSWIYLNRRIVGPVAKLLCDVQRVAAGDIDRQVTSSGPAEVVALGAGVEEMRVRIVGELEQVWNSRRELETKSEQLQRSNSDLEQFAYVASHDLQEPLRKVASFCQLLEQRYADRLDERGIQYLDFAVDGAKRMQRLINDLLSFSRVGRSGLAFHRVSVEEVVGTARCNLASVIEETGAKVEFSDLPEVSGEHSLLVALFQNLIGNGIKFHRPDVVPEVHISVAESPGWWTFTVSDNGIGIDSKYAERVFVIFQRLHSREEYGGTGIGLALCKKIVEHHGGRIWLDQEVESGTTFHFTVPKTDSGSKA